MKIAGTYDFRGVSLNTADYETSILDGALNVKSVNLFKQFGLEKGVV